MYRCQYCGAVCAAGLAAVTLPCNIVTCRMSVTGLSRGCEAGRGLASHCLASLTFTATFASRSAISQRGHFICVAYCLNCSELNMNNFEHAWSKSGTYWHNAMAHVIQIYIFDNSRDFAKKKFSMELC